MKPMNPKYWTFIANKTLKAECGHWLQKGETYVTTRAGKLLCAKCSRKYVKGEKFLERMQSFFYHNIHYNN